MPNKEYQCLVLIQKCQLCTHLEKRKCSYSPLPQLQFLNYRKKYLGGKKDKVKHRILGAFFKCQLLLETIVHLHSLYTTLHKGNRRIVSCESVEAFFFCQTCIIFGDINADTTCHRTKMNIILCASYYGLDFLWCLKKKYERNREIMLTMLFCKVVFFAMGIAVV